MLSWEVLKLFDKHKGWAWIIALILISALATVISGLDSNYMIDENLDSYKNFIRQYGGRVDSYKSQKIENEYVRLLHRDKPDIVMSSKKKAFQVIYHQYTYEKELKNGYIYDYRGWQTLLGRKSTDFIMVTGIIILVTMIYSIEFESDMYGLLLTGKNGKYRSFIAKSRLSVALSVFISCILELIKIIYVNLASGLPYPYAPLNTLEIFSGTGWNISLVQALIIVLAIRALGCVVLALFCAFLTITMKNKVLSILACILAYLIPDIVCKSSEMIYYLPIGMIKGTGYLFPSGYKYELSGNVFKKVCIFHAFSMQGFFAVICMYIVILAALFLVNISLFSRSSLRRAIVAIMVIPVLLSGCGNRDIYAAPGDVFIADGEGDHTTAVINEKRCRISIDYNKNTLIGKMENGEKIRLLNNAFPVEQTIILVFASGSKCYYLMKNADDAGIYIRCLDLKTHEDRYVYSDMRNNSEDFYGLASEGSDDAGVIFEKSKTVDWFFVSGYKLVFMRDNCVYQVDIRYGRKRLIASGIGYGDVRFSGGKLRIKGRTIRIR